MVDARSPAHVGEGGASARRGRFRRRFLACSFAPLLLLGFEASLRLAGYRHPSRELAIFVRNEELRDPDGLHRFDPGSIWAPRPGARLPWAMEEHVSKKGLRGEDPDAAADLRLLVLGDSSTFGQNVRVEETFARRLERRLAETRVAPPGGRAVQVVNGGLLGSTLIQGLGRYREITREWKPDFVLATFGAVNEHWPSKGMPDAELLAFLRRRETAWRALARRLHEDWRVLQWLRAVIPFLEQEEAQPYAERYLRDPAYRRRVSTDEFRQGLEELQALVAADGATLLLVVPMRRQAVETHRWPTREYDPVLREFATARGVDLIDAHAAFQADPRGEERLFCDPYHPSAEGHELLAALLHDALLPRIQARGD